jgi:hypothetical protein
MADTQPARQKLTDMSGSLSTLMREGQGPMVVTFFARDEAEYGKLANSLASFALVNTPTPLDRGAPSAPLNVSGAQTGARAAQQQVTGGSQNVANFALIGNTPATVNNGVVMFNSFTQTYSGNTITMNGGMMTTNGTSTNTGTINQNQSAKGQAATGANEMAPRINNMTQAVQQAAARGGPFRLTLQPAQLEELTRTYQVAVAARGETVMQFQTIGNVAPLTANALTRADLLRRSGFNSESNTATAPASLSKGGAGALSLTPAPTAIDCVITMEPIPGQAPAAGAPRGP